MGHDAHPLGAGVTEGGGEWCAIFQGDVVEDTAGDDDPSTRNDQRFPKDHKVFKLI